MPRLAILVALAVIAYPAAAHASSTQKSFFQDDRLLTSPDPVTQAIALNTVRFLGVDTIHTVVNWSRITSNRKPAHPTDPASYPTGNWDPYDALVRGAQARGIRVLMSPAGPVPNWASACRHNRFRSCKPRPKAYGQFVRAIGRRYSGHYVDEDQEQTRLPKVKQWSLWNEPNLSSWLYPQTVRHRRVGAAYYRKLVYAGIASLRRTGHKRDLILVGETAPIGGNSRNTSPRDFLLDLFCVNGRGQRLRGRTAKRLGCRHAKRIQAKGLSHHPYARGAGVPTSRRQRKGSITIGTIGRFLPVLRAARHSRVAPRRLGVYFTEFGVTTHPPDRKFGVSLKRQAQYLNEVDYLAYKRRWIKSVSQFQLADDINLGTHTFQTGLLFGDWRPKPGYLAYLTPIFIVKKHGKLTIWGQVRPGRAHVVRLQFKRAHTRKWRTVMRKRTNRAGYLLVHRRARRGAWRIAWKDSDGTTYFSRGSKPVPPSNPTTPGLPPPGPGGVPTPPPPSTNPGTPPPAQTAQYTLSVKVSGPTIGSATVTSNPSGINCTSGNTCNAQYASGTAVTLTASHPALQTVNWSGCASSSGDTCTVAMSAARSVTATISP